MSKEKLECDKCGKVKRRRFMAFFGKKVYCSCCKPHIIRVSKKQMEKIKDE